MPIDINKLSTLVSLEGNDDLKQRIQVVLYQMTTAFYSDPSSIALFSSMTEEQKQALHVLIKENYKRADQWAGIILKQILSQRDFLMVLATLDQAEDIPDEALVAAVYRAVPVFIGMTAKTYTAPPAQG